MFNGPMCPYFASRIVWNMWGTAVHSTPTVALLLFLWRVFVCARDGAVLFCLACGIFVVPFVVGFAQQYVMSLPMTKSEQL